MMVENHYLRWREMVKAVSTHNGFLVGSVTHLPFYTDLIDRLREDEYWANTSKGDQPPQAFLMWDHEMPEDVFLIWSKDKGLCSTTEFFGNVGFGRVTFRPISADDVRPWDTA